MIGLKNKKKAYLEVWLKRMRKEFSSSGRLSEIAFILSKEDGSPEREWQLRLRELMNGQIEPDMDLITKLESLIAKPIKQQSVVEASGGLFD